MTFANFIYVHTLANRGGTFDKHGKPLDLESGYCVSIRPDLSRIHAMSDFESVECWIESVRHLVTDGTYYGTWISDGNIHLDLSIITPNIVRAYNLAVKHKQTAIYDLRYGNDLAVSAFSSGYAIEPNRYGDVILYRAIVEPDGELHYDMSVRSVYLQGDDAEPFRDAEEEFILDSSPLASLLSEYFRHD